MKCPRRVDSPVFAYDSEDSYSRDDHCSYCGSLNPDTFMERLEAGTIRLTPTDKNYKVYCKNEGGEDFKTRYRTDRNPFDGWDSPNHDWVERSVPETKFYFMHLAETQKTRFVDLLNQRKVLFGDPGYFYRTPFFIARSDRG